MASATTPCPVKLCIMRVYHRTTANAARHILVNGFRDGEGTYITAQTWRGVWVSDRVLDESESAFFGFFTDLSTAPGAEENERDPWSIEWAAPWPTSVSGAALLHGACRARA
jgi:hypothetical protein